MCHVAGHCCLLGPLPVGGNLGGGGSVWRGLSATSHPTFCPATRRGHTYPPKWHTNGASPTLPHLPPLHTLSTPLLTASDALHDEADLSTVHRNAFFLMTVLMIDHIRDPSNLYCSVLLFQVSLQRPGKYDASLDVWYRM